MINTSDEAAMVEDTVGKKHKVSTSYTDEESEDKKSESINYSRFVWPIRNSLLDPAMAVIDLDQLM